MTLPISAATSVSNAYERMRARSNNVLVVVEGNNSVRLMDARSDEADQIWISAAHKIAGVFNADTSLIDFKNSVRQVAIELAERAAA